MNILYLILVILLTQILAWFQTYGQIKWELMSNNFWLVVLMGLPISYLWMKTATYSFVLFDGKTWLRISTSYFKSLNERPPFRLRVAKVYTFF